MTNNEAIGILELVVETAKGRCFVTDEAISDACEMAINALTRQTALKEKCLVCEHCERCDSELSNNSPKVDSEFGDLISRQVANAAICNACGMIDCDQMDKCKKLFTAQPETHEERTETHACDCISRKAAIMSIWIRLGRDLNVQRPL